MGRFKRPATKQMKITVTVCDEIKKWLRPKESIKEFVDNAALVEIEKRKKNV